MSTSLEIDLAPVDLRADRLRPHAGAKGNWYSHKMDMVWISNTKPGYGKVITHELDHFFLHAFTPFGHFLDEIAVVQRSLAEYYCKAIYNDLKDTIRHPAYTFAASFNINPGTLGIDRDKYIDIVRRLVRPWSKAVFLEDVLEGNDFESVLLATSEDAGDALEICERLCAATFTDTAMFGASALAEIATGQRSPLASTRGANGERALACARASRNGESFPIGAANVFEGHALYTEMHQDGVNQDTLRNAVKDPTLRYLSLFANTVMAFGRERVNSEQEYRQVTRTFLALCDLALFTPVGATYGRLRRKDHTWEDVQPAHRFFKALAVIEAGGHWLSGATHDEYQALHDSISDSLGWARPSEFVALGRRLKGPGEFVRHSKACEIRQQFANPFADEVHGSEHYKQLLMTGGAFLYSPSTQNRLSLLAADKETRLSKLIEYFLRTYCWRVMTAEAAFHLTDCLPPDLDWEVMFDNIKTPKEFLELIGQVDDLGHVFNSKLQRLVDPRH